MVMDARNPRIVDLRDALRFRNAVIRQNHEEWSQTIDMDLDTMTDLFPVDTPAGALPVTLIALIGGRYVGCASLREGPLGTANFPDAYFDGKPWLSNLWVAGWARGQKLATRLVTAIEDEARNLGYKRLFISTFVENSLYEKLGYEQIFQSYIKEKKLRSLQRNLE